MKNIESLVEEALKEMKRPVHIKWRKYRKRYRTNIREF